MPEDPLYRIAEKLYYDQHDIIDTLNRQRRFDLFLVGLLAIIGALAALYLVAPVIHIYISGRYAMHPLMLPDWVHLFYGALVGGHFSFRALNESMRRRAKHILLYPAAAALGLQYRRGGSFPLGELYDHHILPTYGRHATEEGFSGRINGIEIAFQDFHVAPLNRLLRFDYRANMTRFYGLAMRIRTGRRYPEHTVMMPAAFANGPIKRILHEKFFSHRTVNLVYRRFTRRYAVLSTDQVESRVIFDPAVIERMLLFADALGGGWLEISFKDREIALIVGRTRNLFEPGSLWRPITFSTIDQTLGELAYICDSLTLLDLRET